MRTGGDVDIVQLVDVFGEGFGAEPGVAASPGLRGRASVQSASGALVWSAWPGDLLPAEGPAGGTVVRWTTARPSGSWAAETRAVVIQVGKHRPSRAVRDRLARGDRSGRRPASSRCAGCGCERRDMSNSSTAPAPLAPCAGAADA